jgi:alpha-glucosidase
MERNNLLPVSITARDLDDAWFQVIDAIMTHGYRYEVQRGSYEGTDRIELDFATVLVTDPGSGPLLPIIPEGLGIPALADEDYVKCEYFPGYLLSDKLQPNEEYTYGQRIMWPVTDDLLGLTLPQIEWAIKMLKDSGGNTNQATIEIGRPEDIAVHDNSGTGYDPPCMRLIDCRVRYGKLHLVVYFRSWDAWGGFPVNMAGFELLKQWMADEIGVGSGSLIALTRSRENKRPAESGGVERMTSHPWWKIGVIYQIPVASFADSDADGIGDLRGLLGKLDYLNDGTAASLGVDVIWLTPINPSPLRDFGYDVSDHNSINPCFGTMGEFEELLEACHARGMRLMTDLVLNHTSDEHPWFVESRASRDNPRRDWYIWRDGKSLWRPPNRWVSVAEGRPWHYDRVTRQYYYHAFLPFQPDLNWRNPEVRQEMLDVLRFWLDKGVDGFRLDLINFLYEDELLRENPRKLGWRPYFWQHHIYDRSRPESLEAARDLRRLSDSYPDRALMGEVATDERDDAVAYLGDGSDALHLSFYLDFARIRWSAERFRESVGWLEDNIPADGWPCYYLNNHDLSRTFTRLGGGRHAEARAKVAAAMLLTLRGTPIIYAGEEIGMPMSRVPWRVMKDPIGTNYWPLSQGRDGARTPMQWSAKRNAGFTSGKPWLPVDSSHAERNVEDQDTDADSLLNWYRRLIRLRGSRPALHIGSYRVIEDTPKGVYAYVRESGDEKVAVFLNFTTRDLALHEPTLEFVDAACKTLLSTHGDAASKPTNPLRIRLRPHEVLILEIGA